MQFHARLIFVAIAVTQISGCSFFDSKFVAACEEAYKDRLQSPAIYKRVKVEEYSLPMDLGEWITDQYLRFPDAAKTTDIVAKSMLQEDRRPTRFIAFITSDASNAYGTLIRAVTKCEYISTANDIDGASRINILVDGRTNAEWHIEQVQKSAG